MADKRAFVDLPFRLYVGDPNWVPPLKSDVMATITPGKNPWFGHGEAQLFLADGYDEIGIDHFARPSDGMAKAAKAGTLRRNFQGYTDDPAPVLVPVGPSSIGRLAAGFIQNAAAIDVWSRAVEAGRLPVARNLPVSAEDELREVADRFNAMAHEVAELIREIQHGAESVGACIVGTTTAA